MIAIWMLYCLGIGLAFAVAGYALERGLHFAGRPTRWAWVVALVGSCVVPAAAWLRPDAFSTFPAPIPSVIQLSPTMSTSTTSTILHNPPPPSFSISDLDTPLRWGWGLASVAIFMTLAVAARRLVSLRRRWRRATVDGRSVLVSRDVGPAVVGVWSPNVVLPEWALALPAADRELMLAHEEEHLRAADPTVIAVGCVLVLLAPWNLALWWQWRRLRLAVEMDCDARVLAQGRSAPAYGELLLHVGRRRSTQPLGAAAFGEPVSFLESRIRRMVRGVPRWRWAGAVTAVVLAAGAIVGACETPRPVGPQTESILRPTPSTGIVAVVGAVITPRDIDRAPVVLSDATAYFPDLARLAGIEGPVVMEAKIEVTGRADPGSITILESPHPALAQAAKSALVRARFQPAQAHDRAASAVVRVTYDFVNGAAERQQPADVMVQGAAVSSTQVRPLLTRYFGPDPGRLRDSAVIVWFVVNEPGVVVAWGKSVLTAPVDVLAMPQMSYRVIPGYDTLRVAAHLLQADHDLPPTIIVRLGDPTKLVQPLPPPQSTGRPSADDMKTMQTQADRMRRLARQYHAEAFSQPQPNTAVALVTDVEGRVLGHATGIRLSRDATCMDVLTRLLPQFSNAQWLVSGCLDGDAQRKVTVYWATLLKR